MKVRPIDHFSWSASGNTKKKRKLHSVNGATEMPERIRHDHLDELVEQMALFRKLTHEVPALWKLDIDSAFRRVPLREDHRWASAVAFMFEGEAYVTRHNCCAFGAVSSVWAWERIGAVIVNVARRRLKIPAFRYVDDLFAADRCGLYGHACRVGCGFLLLVTGRSAQRTP